MTLLIHQIINSTKSCSCLDRNFHSVDCIAIAYALLHQLKFTVILKLNQRFDLLLISKTKTKEQNKRHLVCFQHLYDEPNDFKYWLQ